MPVALHLGSYCPIQHCRAFKCTVRCALLLVCILQACGMHYPLVSYLVFVSTGFVTQQKTDCLYSKIKECSYLLVLHFNLRWRAATKSRLSFFPLLAVDRRTAMQYYGRYSRSIYVYIKYIFHCLVFLLNCRTKFKNKVLIYNPKISCDLNTLICSGLQLH